MEGELIAHLKALTVGRSDAYLQEGCGCVKEPLSDEVLLDHLRGRRRIGAYSLLPNGHEPDAKFLTLDFDGKNLVGGREEALEQAKRASGVLEELGLPVYLEVSRSGQGYHLWMFYGENHESLASTQNLGRLALRIAKLPEKTEVFPKGRLSDPYGGTPFLPLWGILAGESGVNVFVDSLGKPLPDQQSLLQEIRCVTPGQVERATAKAEQIVFERGKSEASNNFSVPHGSDTNWVAQALKGVGKGQRNTTLTRLAGYFRKRIPLDIAVTILEPFGARCSPALLSQEIHRTVAGVYRRYGEESGTAATGAESGEVEADLLPELPDSCWRPGFAHFRAAYTETTEASDAFLFGGCLVVAGLVLGRNAQLASGVDVYPNFYLTNVGESGRDRKSTAQRCASRLLERVAPTVEHSHGVGSPEGVIQLLAGKDGAPRRVLLEFGETVSLLRKGAQEGSRGLLPLLADLYDCPPSSRLPNRKEDLRAEAPFLCIYGSTTPEWYTGSLTVEDARGGLPGRFLYITGRAKEPIPFPPPPDQNALKELEAILSRMAEHHQEPRRYPLDSDARTTWAEWYTAERARKYPTELLGVLAQRLHLHAWKLALVHAAIEDSSEITVEHIQAGIAFAEYQRTVQAVIFAGFGDSAAVKVDNRILAALKKHGPLAGWEIRQRVRHGVDAENLARRLPALARLGAIEERKEGRRTLWSLSGGQG